MCNASNSAVGTVSSQRTRNAAHAVYYASVVLNGVQLNYTTTEKELLAVIFSLKKISFLFARG